MDYFVYLYFTCYEISIPIQHKQQTRASCCNAFLLFRMFQSFISSGRIVALCYFHSAFFLQLSFYVDHYLLSSYPVCSNIIFCDHLTNSCSGRIPDWVEGADLVSKPANSSPTELMNKMKNQHNQSVYRFSNELTQVQSIFYFKIWAKKDTTPKASCKHIT